MEHSHTLTVTVLIMAFASAFGGYSFPGEAEDHTTDKFQEVNRAMEIDETNYLVNVAGRQYAQCTQAQARSRNSGLLQVSERTEDGRPISGLVDVVDAQHDDSDSLTRYIDSALIRWAQNEPFVSTIKKNNRYGCSIQPNCNGKAVIACLYASV